MKLGSLVAGIVLLIIAIIGYTATANTISEGQSFMGQVERGFSSDAQASYQTNSIAQLAFGGLGVVGLGLIIYGAVASNPKQKSLFHCDYCGFPAIHYADVKQHMLNCSKRPHSIHEDNLKNIGILKERLAKGEITKKEYDELKKEFEK